MSEPKIRPVGGTEYSWCKAVPSGTGITVLGILLSKPPNIPILQSTLHNLQNSHPILRSKILSNPSKSEFSFSTPLSSSLQIQFFDLPATSLVIESSSSSFPDQSISDFHKLLEHEINLTTWRIPEEEDGGADVMFASVYTLSEKESAVFLRLHTSACDRAAAAALLRELLEMVSGGGSEEIGDDDSEKGEVNLGIEDLIPNGKGNKAFWTRGLDMLGYSLNSFRLANLEFKDVLNSHRISQVFRLTMDSDHTQKLLSGCKLRGIKLCGALAAAGMIATRRSKDLLPEQQKEKYAVVTLIDCRSILDPPLSSHHMGFYHSAILNTHDISADENMWEVAKRSYSSFSNAKNNNKHFTDMSDLNFLMCKAIDNPGLTPSSSMRTALISVFEDPVIDTSNPAHEHLGLQDYLGCASVHGVGPSIAFFDTVRDGRLDCACVYPSPLFSREQMNFLFDEMKKILVHAIDNVETDEVEG